MRLKAFDGLRGVAALIVVVHHCLLTYPSLSAAFVPDPTAPTPAGVQWWLLFTPLHLLWAGTEAVFLFFILSGYVLTIPPLRQDSFSWRAYYPSRLLRLYVPIVASVLLAVVWFEVVPRIASASNSGWETTHAEPVSVVTAVKDMVVLLGADALNSPLWSLRWEVIFSLLLPLYVVVAVALRKVWWIVLLVLIPAGLIGATLGGGFVLYLALFAIGTIMAVADGPLERLFDRLGRVGRRVYPLLLVVGVLGITIHWYTVPVETVTLTRLSAVISVASVTLVVFITRYWTPVRAALTTWVPQQLGRLSFSLYLVHEPVVVSIAYLLPPALNWLVLPLGLAASLLLAVGFFKVVEAPAHRLSQQVKRQLAQSSSRTAQPS